jgi:hypothetical protein
MTLRCQHCGAKTKDGKLARVGLARIKARLEAGDGYKQLGYDYGVPERAVAYYWCRVRGVGSRRK